MTIQFEKTRARLDKLAQQVAAGTALEVSDEWGGAGVIIRAKLPKNAEVRVVVTPHSRHLSWLFYELRDAFYDQDLLDHMTKIEFFGRLANAALRCQAHCGDEQTRDELLAVLHEAFAMLDEFEEGTFECLAAAPGNAIADDFVDREEKRGFIGIEETKKFFAERGVELP